jgi:hypothetical protein
MIKSGRAAADAAAQLSRSSTWTPNGRDSKSKSAAAGPAVTFQHWNANGSDLKRQLSMVAGRQAASRKAGKTDTKACTLHVPHGSQVALRSPLHVWSGRPVRCALDIVVPSRGARTDHGRHADGRT